MVASGALVAGLVLTLFLPIYPEGLSVPIVAFLALAAVAAFGGLGRPPARREALALLPWAFALLIAFAVAGLRMTGSQQMLEDCLPYALFAAGCIAARGCHAPRKVLLVTLLVCVTDTLVSLYRMPTYELGMRSTYNYFRITAGLPLVGLYLIAALRVTSVLKHRGVVVGLVLLMSIGVLASVSRGMIIAAGFGLVVAAYVRRPSVVLLWGTVGAGMIFAFSTGFIEFGERYLRFDQSSTIEARVRELQTAFEVFAVNPLFGEGVGAEVEVDGIRESFLHNVVAYHLWKFGLVGSILLFTPLVVIGSTLQSMPRTLRAVAIGGMAAVIAYLTTCAAYKTYYLVWIYGVVVGASLSWFEQWCFRPNRFSSSERRMEQ